MPNKLSTDLSILNNINLNQVVDAQLLKQYEKIIADKSSSDNPIQNPSFYLIVSMVYDFVNKLPYSMDILQDEYVPMGFFNIEPSDVDTNSWFHFSDRRTFFKSMCNLPDTRRTGIFLHLCNIFQQMLLGTIPHNYYLAEKDFERLHIDTMISNDEYDRNFFKVFQKMPEYYRKVESTSNNKDRRQTLIEIYEEMMSYMAARVGGFEHTGIRETKANTIWLPENYVRLLVYNSGLAYTTHGIPEIVEQIKAIQLESYQGKTFAKQPRSSIEHLEQDAP